LEEYDRFFGAPENSFLGSVQPAEPFNRLDIAHHHGKGFFIAQLVFPQPCYCRLVSGIAGQMIPPQPLDRNNSTFPDQLIEQPQGIAALLLSGPVKAKLRPANRTGAERPPVPPAGRIRILPPTIRTLNRYGTGFPAAAHSFIGKRKARTAIRTAGESVPVTPAAPVGNLCRTEITDSDIRGYQLAPFPVEARSLSHRSRRLAHGCTLFLQRQLDFALGRSASPVIPCTETAESQQALSPTYL
jgi:hypothetical protein